MSIRKWQFHLKHKAFFQFRRFYCFLPKYILTIRRLAAAVDLWIIQFLRLRHSYYYYYYNKYFFLFEIYFHLVNFSASTGSSRSSPLQSPLLLLLVFFSVSDSVLQSSWQLRSTASSRGQKAIGVETPISFLKQEVAHERQQRIGFLLKQ